MGIKSTYLTAVNKVRHLFQGRKEHWQDPQVVYRNHIEHHAPLRLLAAVEDSFASVAKDRGETEWVKFIAHRENPSKCQFKLFPNPGSLSMEKLTAHNVEDDRFDDFVETEIPSNWQIQYPLQDPPIYTNIVFPWERNTALTTSVPTKDNPTGCYRINFDIPSNWVKAVKNNERDVFLILHGAGSGVDIFVNGTYMGYGQDSMTETEVCISSAELEEMGNTITLIVYRWTDGSYMEDQDQWWLSGVFRDVELSCRPKSGAICDYIVDTAYEKSADSRVSGQISIQVKTNSCTNNDTPTVIRATLYDDKERKVASSTTKGEANGSFGNESLQTPCFVAKVNLKVECAQLWNVHTPYLYTLVLESLTEESGKPIQVEATRVGIRTVEIRDAQVHVNGEPILVCGVNRHEWELKSGKVIHEETMIHDIKLLKQYNFNAVRNCHYPNNHRWYELCDEYGLFLVDEANIETHGFAKVAHYSLLQCDWKWKSAFLSRVQACVRRSRNRPCIIGWSLGNESGSGPNMRACAKWVRDVDASRPVQYEGGIQSGDSPMIMGDGCDPYCTDIICPMYDSPLRMAQIEAKTNKTSGSCRARPMILCEYAHAMGNSSGNLHLYWNLFRSKEHPKMQGGFIWDMVDQSLSLPEFNDGNWGYGGDFGPTSGKEDKTFCINGMCFGDRSPHPAMDEAKYLQRPMTFLFDRATQLQEDSFTMSVEMFPHCVRLNKVSFEYAILSENQHAPEETGTCTLSSFDDANRLAKITLEKAGEKVRTVLKSNRTAILKVVAKLSEKLPYAEKGHIVAEECFEMVDDFLRKVRPSYESFQARKGEVQVSNVESDNLLRISNDKYAVEFDTISGDVLTFSYADDTPIIEKKGLQHCFFRAPTDNDLGGLDSMLPNELLKPFVSQSQTSFNGQWRRLGLDALQARPTRVNISDYKNDSESVTIEVHHEFSFKGAPRFTTTTCYSFLADGVLVDVKVAASSATQKGALSLPRIGMELVVPGEFSTVEYLGCGPFESYPDRKAATYLGVHRAEVDEMHVKYAMPSECGGRADVQWAELKSTKSKRGLRVTYMFPEGDGVQPEFLDGEDLSKSEPKPRERTSGARGAQFNASRYTIDELDKAQHQWELPEKSATSPVVVHFDTAHMGLGGDVSWVPKTHEQYRVRGKTWSYKLFLQPTK